MLFGSAVIGGRRADFSADPISAYKLSVTPTNATATVTFKRDGSIVNHVPTTLGYWTNSPHSTVGDYFKVKAAKTSGDNFTAQAAADNTYTTDISADRSYSVTVTNDLPDVDEWVGNWTVANLAESQTDSAAGSVKAEVSL